MVKRTAFQMTPTGALTTLVSFDGTHGASPYASLVLGSDGNFYGTTVYGGSAGYGTVFRMTPTGVLTTLVSFTGANGEYPYAALVQGNDGNFYGTTYGGGGNNGTVFKVTPAGHLTTLVSFNGTNGVQPKTGLVQGSDGNFYGTTANGGAFNDGVIFQLIIPQTPAPVFTPASGTYTSPQNVIISTSVNGASIRYTTDGSTPSETNGTIYTGTPVTISTTTTLQAIAFESGFTDSPVTSGLYTIVLPVAAPVFSPAAGTYTSAQAVTIISATSGATIRYTTDGSTPTETNGTIYTNAPVSISVTTTLQAIAFEGGFTDSPVTSGIYTITKVAAPTFSPAVGAYTNAQTVTITSVTIGATIRYTTDGSTPTKTHGTVYSKAVSITATTTLKAIAYKSGFTDSAVTGSTYTLQVAAPVFTPAGGTYTHAQTVNITSATSSASIRYTTDGSTPTETHGTVYSKAVSITATTTFKTIAYKSGFTDSTVTTDIYTINLPPTLNFEAESLAYTPNGATASVQTDTNSSGGKWVQLASNSTGDDITFTVSNVPAGTYQLKMEWKGNNSRGILQLAVDGTNLGGTLDQYASGQTYPTTTFGNVTFSTTGNHTIRLTVTGKNKSSSNYQLSADKFTLVGQ